MLWTNSGQIGSDLCIRHFIDLGEPGRLFAWLQNFRRLVVRWVYHADNFLGFVQLGCAIILLQLFEMASSKKSIKS